VRIDDVEIDCERDAIGILFEAWDNTNELRRITCRGGRMAISGAEPPTQEAAATLAPLPSSDTWVIAGDAEIESIPGDMTQFGRHLTLVFRGTCTINSRRAGNIRLAGELRTAPGTTLCLVYDGEGWVETSRTCEGEREAGPKSSSARFRSDAEATENARAARGAPTGPCSPA
jgi:hypothetical protein